MSFTLNLSGEDALKMVMLDNYFASRNPNYLEDAMPTAIAIHDRISKLIDAKKFDSLEAIELMRMYDGVKQFYLAQFLYN